MIKFVGIFDAVGYAGFSATHIFTDTSDIDLVKSNFSRKPKYQSALLTVPQQVENFYNVYQRYLPFPHDLSRTATYKKKSESTSDTQYERELAQKKDGEVIRVSCNKKWEIGYSSKGGNFGECLGSVFSRSCGTLSTHADIPEICLEDGKRRKNMTHSDVPGDPLNQELIINELRSLQPSTNQMTLSYAKSSDKLLYTSKNVKLDISVLIPPKLGTIVVDKNTFQYVPKKPYRSESDFFKLRLEDPEKKFSVRDALTTVNITPNESPIAYIITMKTRWNSKTVFDPSDPTGIDRVKSLNVRAGEDPDGHLFVMQVTSAPQHGSISVRGGHLIYTPEDEFTGSDQVEFILKDEFGLESNNGKLTINVVKPISNLQARPSGTGQGSGTIVSEPGGINSPHIKQSYDFPKGTFVTLTAIPDKNSIFREWDGAGCSKFGDEKVCKLFMDGAKQILPIFDLAPASYNLTINKAGDGKGIVKSEMPGISCGEECSADYEYGLNVMVNIKAIPDTNSTFLGWSGDCSGREVCIHYMSDDYNITANFALNTPKTFTVTSLDDNGSGSLRQAIVDSNLNPGKDTVNFAKKLKGTITLDNGEMKITDSVSVEGPGTKQIAISGNNNSQIFHLDPGAKLSITIERLTLKDGFDKDENGGGAILINTGDITINEVHFSKNSADNVGGGGAIRKFGQATLTIQNSAFTDCSALSEFEEGVGGAIRIDEGSGFTSIVNTTFSGNRAAIGGALSVSNDSSLRLINSTVTNNTALYSGGGIYSDGEFILGNNIISGNTASDNNEIYNFGALMSLGNNIFGENGTTGITADTNISDNDIILTDSIQTVIQPLSENGGDTPTHMPVNNGLAINTGNDNLYTSLVNTDQRGEGNFRNMNNIIDIGSVEKYAPLVVTYRISSSVGETIQLPILQGHPVLAKFENIDIASGNIIADTGEVFIVGESSGSTTLLLGDTQANMSKILIEILEPGSKPSIPLETKITGLYIAFFNRAADQEGLDYWSLKGENVQMRGENVSNVLKELSAGFATHPTFISTYAHLGNQAFVEAIYRNSLGRDGDAEGIVYWTGKINLGMSRSDMVATFVELSLVTELSKENYPNLTDEELAVAQIRQDLISNKAEVAQVFTAQLDTLSNVADNQNPEGDPAYQASIKILSAVTYEERTMICAISFLKEFANGNGTQGIKNINSIESTCANTPTSKR